MNLLLITIVFSLPIHKNPKNEHINPTFLFEQINAYRKENNIPVLEYLPGRQREADRFSEGLTTKFAHTQESYFYENLSKTYDSSRILLGWINSRGHNKNLLERKIKYTVISIYKLKDQSGVTYYYSVFRGYKEKRKTRN